MRDGNVDWTVGLLGALVALLLTWAALFFLALRPTTSASWHPSKARFDPARPHRLYRRSSSASSVLSTTSVDSFDSSAYTLVQSRPCLLPLRPSLRTPTGDGPSKRVVIVDPTELDVPLVPQRSSSAERRASRAFDMGEKVAPTVETEGQDVLAAPVMLPYLGQVPLRTSSAGARTSGPDGMVIG